MKKHTLYVGLDVHAETIAVAVAEEGRDGEVRSHGRIPNERVSIGKLIKKLGGPKRLRVCYEAGPCGYVLYWQLVELGVACEVIAPTLVPVKAGVRVKTDKRDAIQLARTYRAGELTAVWVPDHSHEALRDLMRAREAAKEDQRCARLRLGGFLLRHGRRRPQQVKAWGSVHMMGYCGVVPSEHSTGGPGKERHGAITKTGNAHLRRVLVEAAWSYRHSPRLRGDLRRRQQGLSDAVQGIAWQAQHRLHHRYRHLRGRNKESQKVVTAIGRELLGFIWAIGVQIEHECQEHRQEQPNHRYRIRRTKVA